MPQGRTQYPDLGQNCGFDSTRPQGTMQCIDARRNFGPNFTRPTNTMPYWIGGPNYSPTSIRPFSKGPQVAPSIVIFEGAHVQVVPPPFTRTKEACLPLSILSLHQPSQD